MFEESQGPVFPKTLPLTTLISGSLLPIGQEALTLTQASLCLPCPSLSKESREAAYSALLDN